MKNEYITNWQSATVFAQITEIDKGRELRDALVVMALQKGLSREDSETLTARIMSGVYAYENTREMLETNVEDAAAPLFEQLSAKTPEEQAAALDQILFGFEVFGDDELFRQAMIDSKKAYASHRGDIKFGPESVETLKAELLKKMGNMNLSPKAMKHMISELKGSGDYTAAAAALGRQGFALKSVAAMATYLDAGEDADITKAVIGACASVDMQAVGDAVNRGLMARDAAGIILGLIVFTVCMLFAGLCFGFAWAATVLAISESMPIAFLLALIAGMTGLGAMDLITVLAPFIDKASDSVGQLTVLLSGLFRKGRESVDSGLRAVAGQIAEENTASDAAEAVEAPEPDWVLNQIPDLAF